MAESPVKKKINKKEEEDTFKTFELKRDYDALSSHESNDRDYNKFLLKKELIEHNYLKENDEEVGDSLYPNLNDPQFNIKIAEKKEFNDTKYDGEIDEKLTVEEQADILSKADFEIAPHQAFVRNFMSFQTPYNSLLLFHGLGSGKTCSAIGVCEEMRDYLKQMGISKRIIVVASPNVQENFKKQLFHEKKLELVNGLWNIRSCTGNKYLKEINPMSMKGLSKEKVISQVKMIINNSYMFLGYDSFANYIKKIENGVREVPSDLKENKKGQKTKKTENDVNSELKESKKRKKTIIEELDDIKRRHLNNEFKNRLIVIDEVHNIRITDDNENKKVAIYLSRLVDSVENLRLLFLSATPMYNSHKEIIFLLNLMNANDGRGKIEVKQVFDKDGNFKEGGEELLSRKATGYISFVRGENPFTFPYKVYPKIFAPSHTFGKKISYPTYQMNGKRIDKDDRIKILDVYLTNIGDYQSLGYKYIIDKLRTRNMSITLKTGKIREMPSFENMEAFGYTLLQPPLEALIIVYPIVGLENYVSEVSSASDFTETAEKIELIEEQSESSKDIKKEEDIKYESEAEKEEIDDTYEDEDEAGVPKMTTVNTEKTLIDSFDYNKKSVATDKTLIDSSIYKKSKKSAIGGAKKKELIIESESESESVDSGRDNDEYEYEIDPNDLVGRRGLSRIMKFVDTTYNPAEKGKFEYKKKYEHLKMFAPSNIGKYSSKIKNICENIVKYKSNGDVDTVSKGIVIIYSQYIDGGLIPMALALEEMGLTRYGKDTSNLFKTPPTEPIDVRTMKPREKNTKDFMPARYIMITGDPRLSPNNGFEVDGVTSEDNYDGHKIKVVLISLAGSEGLDFKFLRQVHILEPWYNMNRLEQIFGRAIRNFSHVHKDLPFQERNVEIFMHGTILQDKNEEAADLYVYRCAEEKAIQIGRVTRLLKESSVDCILNYEQTNFTQKNFEKILKKKHETVKQVLSNGMVINDFKIGDMPYTSACDYMEDCEYKCRPFKEITDSDINEDTYNESFIMVNSEKLLQKVRSLFSDKEDGRFFFKKDELIRQLKGVKDYPLVQIYYVLTQLVNDATEFIVDKYGRKGRLVNVGDYYLFQPNELENKNISIFERSVPLDYKTEKIRFEIKETLTDEKMVNYPEKQKEKEEEKEIIVKHKGKDVFDKMLEKFNIAKQYTKEKTVSRGDKDENTWYKHCGITIKKMASENVPVEDLLQFLVEHIVDMLVYKEKLDVLNYLYSIKVIPEKSFEEYCLDYLNSKIIKVKKLTALEFYNIKQRIILILDNKTNSWSEAEPEDEFVINNEINKRPTPGNFNNLIGFIDYEVKTGNYMVFKVKDLLEKRNTGARCDGAGKKDTIILLNKIIGAEKYNKENTKGMIQEELCSLQEFTLRYYNKIKKNNKIFFLDPSNAKNYGF